MNRRSFLSLMATAAAATALPSLASEARGVIPWRNFCSLGPGPHGKATDSPWVVFSETGVEGVSQGHTVATDCVSLLVVDWIDGRVEGQSLRERPSIWHLPWGDFKQPGWRPVRVQESRQELFACRDGCPGCRERNWEPCTHHVGNLWKLQGQWFDGARVDQFQRLGPCEVRVNSEYRCLAIRGDRWRGFVMGGA